MQPKEIFDLAPFYEMECKPSALLVAIGATPSHSEAKRLIKQGAVQVNKQIISNTLRQRTHTEVATPKI